MFEIINNQYNIAYYCTQYQCEKGNSEKAAIRWVLSDLSYIDINYGHLNIQSNKCANMLKNLDIGKGDNVMFFLPKSPEQFYLFLGALKIEAVACILFSNFGENALLDRLNDSQATLVITTSKLFKKISGIWKNLNSLKKVILTDIDEHQSENILSYSKLISESDSIYSIPNTSAETHSVLHYTSGSTGKPKGVLHIHKSLLRQVDTFRNVLNVKQKDIYWCTADQGWVTGVSYGIIAPLCQGITQIQYAGNFNPLNWIKILEQHKVNIFYTAPTALRMLMNEKNIDYQDFAFHNLKYIFSVGEPLNPSVIEWTKQNLGKDVYDTWFQTETGSIMISNRPGLQIKPGSMGKPYQIEAVILDENDKLLSPGMKGRLCIKPGWNSMFVNYLNNEEKYADKFKSGFYDTGDLAYQDDDGYFWFFGRDDDVINTSGHLVGPFEVESALLALDEVIEAGVIGVPDTLQYEKIVAYIRLADSSQWSKKLELKIRIHIANRLSSIAIPQEFVLVESIPKNKSGKIMRRVLRSWYTHEDLDDLSTLEK